MEVTKCKGNPPPLTDEGIERLRYVIVRQACKDFNSAYFERKRLERKKKPTEKEIDRLMKARAMESECLQFFHSGWYSALCDIDPDNLIRALKARRIKEGAIK